MKVCPSERPGYFVSVLAQDNAGRIYDMVITKADDGLRDALEGFAKPLKVSRRPVVVIVHDGHKRRGRLLQSSSHGDARSAVVIIADKSHGDGSRRMNYTAQRNR
jgi:hypothetical protein